MNRRFTVVKSDPTPPPPPPVAETPLEKHELDKLRSLRNAYLGVSERVQKEFVKSVLGLDL